MVDLVIRTLNEFGCLPNTLLLLELLRSRRLLRLDVDLVRPGVERLEHGRIVLLVLAKTIEPIRTRN